MDVGGCRGVEVRNKGRKKLPEEKNNLEKLLKLKRLFKENNHSFTKTKRFFAIVETNLKPTSFASDFKAANV